MCVLPLALFVPNMKKPLAASLHFPGSMLPLTCVEKDGASLLNCFGGI